MNGQSTPTEGSIRKTWAAFGPNGAIGSIHALENGFAVRRLGDSDYRGVYPSLEIAKRAMTAGTADGDQVQFSAH